MSTRRRLRDLERGYGVGQPRDPNIIEAVVEAGLMRTMTEDELAHPGCSCFSNSVGGSDGLLRELHQGHLTVTKHTCGAPQQTEKPLTPGPTPSSCDLCRGLTAGLGVEGVQRYHDGGHGASQQEKAGKTWKAAKGPWGT